MDTKQFDQVVQRTAALAILYRPEIGADDPAYSLTTDTDWVLEGLDHLHSGDRKALRDVIACTILDPTGHRHELLAALGDRAS